MSDTFGGEQVSELAPLAPDADIDEIRQYLMRQHQWVRSREPVAAGDPLSKFVLRGELLEIGLVGYEAGAPGAGNSNITISNTIISGGSGSGSGSGALAVVDDAGASVDLVVDQIRYCTNVAAVTATLPSTSGLARGSVCGIYCTNGLTTNEVDRNGGRIAGEEENLVLDEAGWVVLFQLIDPAEGWAVFLRRLTL